MNNLLTIFITDISSGTKINMFDGCTLSDIHVGGNYSVHCEKQYNMSYNEPAKTYMSKEKSLSKIRIQNCIINNFSYGYNNKINILISKCKINNVTCIIYNGGISCVK